MSETSLLFRARAKLNHVIGGDFRGPSLASRVIRGSGWTIAGNFSGQALRLVSNVWLTHLLYPAAFGVVAMAQAFIAGANMLSDVGLQQSVIRSQRTHDHEFLDTIWTLKILKGAIIFLFMIVIAPFAAHFYKQPMLTWILPGLGAAVLINGFESTKMAMLNRNIEIRRIVTIELGAQIIGILVMGFWAWLSPSPWALVGGNLIGALTLTLATHLFIHGRPNRFALQRATVKEVSSFGRLVMLSSGLTYLVGEGRNLLNGSLVDSRTMGLLVLSTTLMMVIWNAIQSVSGRVLYPAYSKVWHERPQSFPSVVERSRRFQLLAGCVGGLVFVLFGDRLVNFVYDARYREAGAFLQIQAVGSIVWFLGNSYGGVLWARDRVGTSIVLLIGLVVATVSLMLGGYAAGGVLGLVIGVSLTGLAVYPFNAVIYARMGLFQPRTDFPPFVLAILLAIYVYLFGAWRGITF